MTHLSPSTGRPGYEVGDARPAPLVAFAIGLVLLVTAVLAISALLAAEREADTGTPAATSAHPMAPDRGEPSGPLLQTAPAAELAWYLEKERETLSTYGWVDQAGGVARIPIERAMEILLERGLDARAPAAEGER